MPGERRLTSIKQLVNDMLFNANLTGTITIDEIANTVTVQLVEPVTIDGTINIGTMPSITIQDIINLNVDSLPPITGTIGISGIGGTLATNTTITNNPLQINESLNTITLTSSVVTVAAADTLVLAANANRKFLLIQRGTTVGRVFVKFSAGAATVTNGVLFRENAYFSFNPNEIYTGEIRAISVGSSKILYVTEGV